MKRTKEMDKLFQAVLSLKTVDECYRLFEDMCTIKELDSFRQRLQVAEELDAGKNYNEIYENTGVSSATISRVNKCLHYGNGGYRLVLDRLKAMEEDKNA